MVGFEKEIRPRLEEGDVPSTTRTYWLSEVTVTPVIEPKPEQEREVVVVRRPLPPTVQTRRELPPVAPRRRGVLWPAGIPGVTAICCMEFVTRGWEEIGVRVPVLMIENP